jgi:hypothetical protein
MFKNNKWYCWYKGIILSAKYREDYNPLVGYIETHHVIPRSLGGTNDKNNLVQLTAKEHFICHHLLTKFTHGDAADKMWMAYDLFFKSRKLNDGKNYRITARMYERVKKAISQIKKEMWTDSVLAQQFRDQSDATKQEILDWIDSHAYNFLNIDGTHTTVNYRPGGFLNPKTDAERQEKTLNNKIFGYDSNQRPQHKEFLEKVLSFPTLNELKIKEQCSNYIKFLRDNGRPPRKGTPLHSWRRDQATEDEEKCIADRIIIENMTIIPNKVKNLTGKKFHRLVVIKFSGTKDTGNGSKAALWTCSCVCGNTITTISPAKMKSCGCV